MINDEQDGDYLTRLALLTLEKAAHETQKGIVARTWGIRLALTYLNRFAMVKESSCAEFWKAIVNPHSAQASETVANICRGNSTSACLKGIYRQAGVQRSPDMMYIGAVGTRSERSKAAEEIRRVVAEDAAEKERIRKAKQCDLSG